MNQFKIMETPDLWQWIEMVDTAEPEGIRQRCTLEYITEKFEALKGTRLVKDLPQLKKMEIAAVEIFDKGVYTEPGMPDVEDIPPLCQVTVKSDIGGGRVTRIKVFLPFVWNGRLLANTGGGSASEQPFSIGEGDMTCDMLNMARSVRNYFASVVTDNAQDPIADSGTWGFKEGTDELDWNMVLQWAYIGTHDMIVIAKEFCKIVYLEAPAYTYIGGSSAGGRQTMTHVQLYPGDIDGAYATHPAVPWVPLHISEAWPFIVLNNSGHKIPHVKFEAMRAAILEKYGCTDKQYVDSTFDIEFDFDTLLGKETEAGPFTERDVEILKKIYAGPTYSDGRKMPECEPFNPLTRIWRSDILHGQTPIQEDGSLEGQGMLFVVRQIFSWVTRKPDYDMHECTYEDVDWIYDRGKAEFHFADGQRVDMREFRDKGGKVIYTMPNSDGMVPHKTARKYYEEVTRYFGEEETNKFFKFYYTHGGAHTALDPLVFGEQLALGDAWKSLMKWVEEGVAPDEIATVSWDLEKNGPVSKSAVKPYSNQ